MKLIPRKVDIELWLPGAITARFFESESNIFHSKLFTNNLSSDLGYLSLLEVSGC